MKIIMILTNGFAPDLRVYKEAKYLTQKGNEVEILCWDRENQHINKPVEQLGKIKIVRFFEESKYGSGLKQIFKLLQFKKACKKYLKTIDYQYIHCHDLDGMLVGYLLHKRGDKLIFDMHEYYNSGSYAKIYFIVKRLLKFLQNKSYKIIHVNEKQIENMEEKNKKIVLLKLFISTLYLSTFTFGGGYVIVTLMKKKFVDEYHWIEENEMLDLVAIAQSSPGAIAVNGAIVVGYKLAGAAGIFVAILGTVLPPFVILSVISIFYNAFRNNWLISQLLEGMQAGVGAVIASVTVDMGLPIIKEKDALSLVIMVGAFIVACVFSINVVYIVLTCGIIGVIRTLLSKRRSGK